MNYNRTCSICIKTEHRTTIILCLHVCLCVFSVCVSDHVYIPVFVNWLQNGFVKLSPVSVSLSVPSDFV